MVDDAAEQFFKALSESLDDDTFVKLSLGKYRGDEVGLKNVYVRRVSIRGADHLSFLYRYQTKDMVKNHPLGEARDELRGLLGGSFLSGHLFTLRRDYQLEFSKKLRPRLATARPTFAALPPTAHDQPKRRFIELGGNPYLNALGVTNERGEVREKRGDKFRQINKFVEVVEGLYASSALAGKSVISIVDMGAGKGYLTFAVYDYFNNHLGIEAEVTGVEARTELVELGNDIARRANFLSLAFRPGRIDNFVLEQTDILIALHACDTATDDALYKGIASGASVIITAPCCHKELRPQIEPPAVLRPLLRHGILLERQAEMLTDSLRALLLEYSGYATKVFEFISTEHTAKNTMIVGVKHGQEKDPRHILQQIEALKDFYGIREQRLERLLFARE